MDDGDGGGVMMAGGLARSGVATQSTQHEQQQPSSTSSLLGSPGYMAPELVLATGGGLLLGESQAGYSFGVDVWALGCCVHRMLCGQHFCSSSLEYPALRAWARAPQLPWSRSPEIWACPDGRVCRRECAEAVALVSGMLEPSLPLRLTASGVLDWGRRWQQRVAEPPSGLAHPSLLPPSCHRAAGC
jgi:serine/threonine protein kinase